MTSTSKSTTKPLTMTEEKRKPIRRELLDELGDVTVKLDGERTIIDAGEWSGSLRALKASEAARTLLLLGGPADGLPVRYELGDAPVLIVSDGQHEYRFTRR